MHTYTIKHNSYPLGTAKSKSEAVIRVCDQINRFHKGDGAWKDIAGVISCTVKTGEYEEVYTIEKG